MILLLGEKTKTNINFWKPSFDSEKKEGERKHNSPNLEYNKKIQEAYH